MRLEACVIADAKGIPKHKDATLPRNSLVELRLQAADDKGVDVIFSEDDVEVGAWQGCNLWDGFHVARQLAP